MEQNVVIITDSTCDLNQSTINERNIVVLPLYINFSFGSYKDGDGINTKELYSLVQKHNELPKTAAITLGDFITTFKKYINEGKEIIYAGISSQISKTYENALLAAKEVCEEKIFVVDSANLSTGVGLQILMACKYRDENKSAKEIAALMWENVNLVRSQFVVQKMDYLHKSGRCNAITRLFGTIFRIKPLVVIRKGKMSVAKIPHGKMKFGLDALLKMISEDKDNLDLDTIFITHSQTDECRDYLLKKLRILLPHTNIIVTKTGCVISSYCGDGTIGIVYMLKK